MSAESEEKQADADVAIVKRHVAELGEHFDSVQIFVTRFEAGVEQHTVSVQLGSGNWFARMGHIRDWLVKEDEATRLKVRKDESETE